MSFAFMRQNYKIESMDELLCRLSHLPFIWYNGRRFVSWLDVGEIFFWCSNPNCTVTLKALKCRLKYPESDTYMHQCSPSEHLLFLKKFVVIPVGTWLLELAAIQNESALKTLNSMIRFKHERSRKCVTVQCYKEREEMKTIYNQIEFLVPLNSISKGKLLPAILGVVQPPEQDSPRKENSNTNRGTGDQVSGALESKSSSHQSWSKDLRMLIPLSVIADYVSGSRDILQQVIQQYLQRTWEQTNDSTVCQCGLIESLHLTKFLASQSSYDGRWQCVTRSSVMMDWTDFFNRFQSVRQSLPSNTFNFSIYTVNDQDVYPVEFKTSDGLIQDIDEQQLSDDIGKSDKDSVVVASKSMSNTKEGPRRKRPRQKLKQNNSNNALPITGKHTSSSTDSELRKDEQLWRPTSGLSQLCDKIPAAANDIEQVIELTNAIEGVNNASEGQKAWSDKKMKPFVLKGADIEATMIRTTAGSLLKSGDNPDSSKSPALIKDVPMKCPVDVNSIKPQPPNMVKTVWTTGIGVDKTIPCDDKKEENHLITSQLDKVWNKDISLPAIRDSLQVNSSPTKQKRSSSAITQTPISKGKTPVKTSGSRSNIGQLPHEIVTVLKNRAVNSRASVHGRSDNDDELANITAAGRTVSQLGHHSITYLGGVAGGTSWDIINDGSSVNANIENENAQVNAFSGNKLTNNNSMFTTAMSLGIQLSKQSDGNKYGSSSSSTPDMYDVYARKKIPKIKLIRGHAAEKPGSSGKQSKMKGPEHKKQSTPDFAIGTTHTDNSTAVKESEDKSEDATETPNSVNDKKTNKTAISANNLSTKSFRDSTVLQKLKEYDMVSDDLSTVDNADVPPLSQQIRYFKSQIGKTRAQSAPVWTQRLSIPDKLTNKSSLMEKIKKFVHTPLSKQRADHSQPKDQNENSPIESNTEYTSPNVITDLDIDMRSNETLQKIDSQLYYKVPGDCRVYPVNGNVFVPGNAQFFMKTEEGNFQRTDGTMGSRPGEKAADDNEEPIDNEELTINLTGIYTPNTTRNELEQTDVINDQLKTVESLEMIPNPNVSPEPLYRGYPTVTKSIWCTDPEKNNNSKRNGVLIKQCFRELVKNDREMKQKLKMDMSDTKFVESSEESDSSNDADVIDDSNALSIQTAQTAIPKTDRATKHNNGSKTKQKSSSPKSVPCKFEVVDRPPSRTSKRARQWRDKQDAKTSKSSDSLTQRLKELQEIYSPNENKKIAKDETYSSYEIYSALRRLSIKRSPQKVESGSRKPRVLRCHNKGKTSTKKDTQPQSKPGISQEEASPRSPDKYKSANPKSSDKIVKKRSQTPATKDCYVRIEKMPDEACLTDRWLENVSTLIEDSPTSHHGRDGEKNNIKSSILCVKGDEDSTKQVAKDKVEARSETYKQSADFEDHSKIFAESKAEDTEVESITEQVISGQAMDSFKFLGLHCDAIDATKFYTLDGVSTDKEDDDSCDKLYIDLDANVEGNDTDDDLKIEKADQMNISNNSLFSNILRDLHQCDKNINIPNLPYIQDSKAKIERPAVFWPCTDDIRRYLNASGQLKSKSVLFHNQDNQINCNIVDGGRDNLDPPNNGTEHHIDKRIGSRCLAGQDMVNEYGVIEHTCDHSNDDEETIIYACSGSDIAVGNPEIDIGHYEKPISEKVKTLDVTDHTQEDITKKGNIEKTEHQKFKRSVENKKLNETDNEKGETYSIESKITEEKENQGKCDINEEDTDADVICTDDKFIQDRDTQSIESGGSKSCKDVDNNETEDSDEDHEEDDWDNKDERDTNDKDDPKDKGWSFEESADENSDTDIEELDKESDINNVNSWKPKRYVENEHLKNFNNRGVFNDLEAKRQRIRDTLLGCQERRKKSKNDMRTRMQKRYGIHISKSGKRLADKTTVEKKRSSKSDMNYKNKCKPAERTTNSVKKLLMKQDQLICLTNTPSTCKTKMLKKKGNGPGGENSNKKILAHQISLEKNTQKEEKSTKSNNLFSDTNETTVKLTQSTHREEDHVEHCKLNKDINKTGESRYERSTGKKDENVRKSTKSNKSISDNNETTEKLTKSFSRKSDNFEHSQLNKDVDKTGRCRYQTKCHFIKKLTTMIEAEEKGEETLVESSKVKDKTTDKSSSLDHNADETNSGKSMEKSKSVQTLPTVFEEGDVGEGEEILEKNSADVIEILDSPDANKTSNKQKPEEITGTKAGKCVTDSKEDTLDMKPVEKKSQMRDGKCKDKMISDNDNNDNGEVTEKSTMMRSKKRTSNVRNEFLNDLLEIETQKDKEKQTAEGLIQTQMKYYQILKGSGTSREKKDANKDESKCSGCKLGPDELPSGILLQGQRDITKALSEAEKALEGTGKLNNDPNRDKSGVLIHDMAHRCTYQLIEDEDHVQLGGIAYYKDYILPFVYNNGYKYTPLKDVLCIFQPWFCSGWCTIPRKVLQKDKHVLKTFSDWEQTYKLNLIKEKKKPTVTTGDTLLRLDSLLSNLATIVTNILQEHKGTKLKRSQNCRTLAYKRLLKELVM